jgi:ornithine cyclodeaminase
VAARHLANQGATSVAILGAGVQARLQLEALGLVRDIERAVVWARDPSKAERFASTVSSELGLDVRPAIGVEEAVADADVVITTTPSTEPIVDLAMIAPGTHVTAVGSDAEHKQELSVSLVTGADLFVCDSVIQSRRLGELRAVDAAGKRVDAVELGDVIAGRRGRPSEVAITICDLTGTGAQDTAIAGLAAQRAVAAGRGTVFAT